MTAKDPITLSLPNPSQNDCGTNFISTDFQDISEDNCTNSLPNSTEPTNTNISTDLSSTSAISTDGSTITSASSLATSSSSYSHRISATSTLITDPSNSSPLLYVSEMSGISTPGNELATSTSTSTSTSTFVPALWPPHLADDVTTTAHLIYSKGPESEIESQAECQDALHITNNDNDNDNDNDKYLVV